VTSSQAASVFALRAEVFALAHEFDELLLDQPLGGLGVHGGQHSRHITFEPDDLHDDDLGFGAFLSHAYFTAILTKAAG
jgi:hypothetical protein